VTVQPLLKKLGKNRENVKMCIFTKNKNKVYKRLLQLRFNMGQWTTKVQI